VRERDEPSTLTLAWGRAALEQDGFVVFDQLFTPEELREVEQIADRLLSSSSRSNHDPPFRRFLRDMAPKKASEAGVFDGVYRQPELEYAGCLAPELLTTGVFRKCSQMATALGGSISRRFDHLIYKLPDSRTATPWHQDIAYAKAKLDLDTTALHFWIPLQDATTENGCMHFERGSHRTPVRRHGQYDRRTGGKGFQAAETELADPVSCPVQRGGLTIHTPRTLHYAGPNTTGETRKVWIIQFARLGAARLKVKQLLGEAPGPLLE
jgi:hypothetical protein